MTLYENTVILLQFSTSLDFPLYEGGLLKCEEDKRQNKAGSLRWK